MIIPAYACMIHPFPSSLTLHARRHGQSAGSMSKSSLPSLAAARPLPPPDPVDEEPSLARWISWGLIGLVAALLIIGHSVQEQPDPATSTVSTELSFTAPLQLAAHLAGEEAALDDLRALAATDIDRFAIAIVEQALRDEPSVSLAELDERWSERFPTLTGLIDQVIARTGGMTLADDGWRRRLGWFAELVEAGGLQPGPLDPAFRATVERRPLLLATGGLLAVLLLGGGLSLALIAFNRWRRHQGRFRFRPERDPQAAYLGAFAIYLLLFVVFMTVLMVLAHYLAVPPAWRPLGMWSFVLLLPIPLAWLLLNGEAPTAILPQLGWHRGAGYQREIVAGLHGYLVGLPVLLTGFACTWLLGLAAGEQATHRPAEDLIAGGTPAWVLYSLIVGFAPLVEETFFRGALHRHLRSRHGFLCSATLGGLVFAAIHPQGLLAIPVLSAIAIVLAGIRETRDSLIGCVVAHALHNGLVLSVALLIYR